MSCGEDILRAACVESRPAFDRYGPPVECFLDPKISRLALNAADTFVAGLVAATSQVFNCSTLALGPAQTMRGAHVSVRSETRPLRASCLHSCTLRDGTCLCERSDSARIA